MPAHGDPPPWLFQANDHRRRRSVGKASLPSGGAGDSRLLLGRVPLRRVSGFVIAVSASLTAAAIWAAGLFLRNRDKREHLSRKLKQSTCHHEWRSLDERSIPGSGLVFISPDKDECTKCGARR
jgi:hypothetical protein